MKMFRCLACPDEAGKPHEFTAEKPICPRCGLDGTQPRDAELILLLTVIHFDAPSRVPNRGVGYLACQPDTPLGRGHVATGLPAVVNCPACRETEAFTRHDAAVSFDPRHDIRVKATPTVLLPHEEA